MSLTDHLPWNGSEEVVEDGTVVLGTASSETDEDSGSESEQRGPPQTGGLNAAYKKTCDRYWKTREESPSLRQCLAITLGESPGKVEGVWLVLIFGMMAIAAGVVAVELLSELPVELSPDQIDLIYTFPVLLFVSYLGFLTVVTVYRWSWLGRGGFL